MDKYREGDVNRRKYVKMRKDAWINSYDGIVYMKNPGDLCTLRLKYRDNPVNGLGEKESVADFNRLGNLSPWFITVFPRGL